MAARKPQAEALTGGSLLRIVTVLFGFIVIILLGMHSANFIMGRALLVAFGGLETTYRAARPTVFGDVLARDVVVYLPDGDPASAIRFDKALVETPGLFWFLRSTYHRKLSLPRADEMALVLHGGVSPMGYDLTLGELGFGGATASPFEAEGCAEDNVWVPAELADMGLDAGPATVRFQWTVADRVLTTVHTVDIPSVSSALHERRERMNEASTNVLLLEFASDSQVLSERWEVEDRGFVRARNAHCARKDRVPVETFVARHIAAVERLMESEGLAADPAMVETYRAFARRGGKLALGGDYTRWVSYNAEYSEESWGDTLARLGGELTVDNRRTPLVWSRIAPRELPDTGDPTTFEVLVREGRAPGVVAAIAAEPGLPDAGESSTPLPAASPEVAASAQPVAVAAPPGSSSTPDGWREDPRAGAIPFDELGRYVGWQLQVTLASGRTTLATVREANAERVVLEVQLRGGHASYAVRREGLVLARLP